MAFTVVSITGNVPHTLPQNNYVLKNYPSHSFGLQSFGTTLYMYSCKINATTLMIKFTIRNLRGQVLVCHLPCKCLITISEIVMQVSQLPYMFRRVIALNFWAILCYAYNYTLIILVLPNKSHSLWHVKYGMSEWMVICGQCVKYELSMYTNAY